MNSNKFIPFPGRWTFISGPQMANNQYFPSKMAVEGQQFGWYIMLCWLFWLTLLLVLTYISLNFKKLSLLPSSSCRAENRPTIGKIVTNGDVFIDSISGSYILEDFLYTTINLYTTTNEGSEDQWGEYKFIRIHKKVFSDLRIAIITYFAGVHCSLILFFRAQMKNLRA